MVIFGWGGNKFTDHGAAWRQTCPNCHNSGWFHYATTHSSFRLYFISLIPYGRKHFLMCPICNKGPQLTEPGVATVKQAMRLLARARAGELTESQYNTELAMLLSPATAVLPAGAPGIDGPAKSGLPAPRPRTPRRRPWTPPRPNPRSRPHIGSGRANATTVSAR